MSLIDSVTRQRHDNMDNQVAFVRPKKWVQEQQLYGLMWVNDDDQLIVSSPVSQNRDMILEKQVLFFLRLFFGPKAQCDLMMNTL